MGGGKIALGIEPQALAAADANDEIVLTPEGDVRDYAMSLYAYANQIMPDYDEYDLKRKVCFSSDGNTIWFSGFFMAEIGGWAKGMLNDGIITVPSGQYVADSNGEKLYLMAFAVKNNQPALVDGIEFRISDNGEIKCVDASIYVGLWYYTSDTQMSLTTAYSHEHTFRPVTEKSVEVPSGASVGQYLLKAYDSWRDGEVEYVVDVARNGNDVYINGLAFDAKTSWVKGSFANGEIVFQSNQAIDGNDTYWLKLSGMKLSGSSMFGDTYSPTESFSFVVSDDWSTLILKEGLIGERYMFDNSNFDMMKEVVLTKYSGDKPAVPADPSELKFHKSSELGDSFTFLQPATDKDGNSLNPDKLYYRVYVDDTPYTFTIEKYPNLDAPLSEVPFSYFDSYYFKENYNGKYKLFYFNEADWNTLDVESVYVVDGVENVSNKVRCVNPNGGIGGVAMEKEPVNTRYTDLMGRSFDEPVQAGFYLKTVTYSDGSVQTIKINYKP